MVLSVVLKVRVSSLDFSIFLVTNSTVVWIDLLYERVLSSFTDLKDFLPKAVQHLVMHLDKMTDRSILLPNRAEQSTNPVSFHLFC